MLCRLLAMIWGFSVAADLVIFAAPGLWRRCSTADGAPTTSSKNLELAFLMVLAAHIVQLLVCVYATHTLSQAASKAASGSHSNTEGSDCNNNLTAPCRRSRHSDSATWTDWFWTNEQYLLVSMQLVVYHIAPAVFAAALGYGSLSNIPADDCLHGAVELVWFQSWLWLFNLAWFISFCLVVLVGIMVAALLGALVVRECLNIYKACCSFKSSSEAELTEGRQELDQQVSAV